MSIDVLLVSIATAVAAGLIGCFAVIRRMALAADALSHVALPGIGLALAFHVHPLIGALAALFFGALLVWSLEDRARVATDTIIGIVFSAALAIGSLLTSGEALVEVLFGRVGRPSTAEVVFSLVAAAVVVLFVLKRRHHLVVALVSPDLARTSGIDVRRLNLVYLQVFALTVALGLRHLGVLLMGSLIIIPAATARRLADRSEPDAGARGRDFRGRDDRRHDPRRRAAPRSGAGHRHPGGVRVSRHIRAPPRLTGSGGRPDPPDPGAAVHARDTTITPVVTPAPAMRLTIAQLNFTVGAFDANFARMRAAVAAAEAAASDLVIFSELAATGYPPRDLVTQPRFVDRQSRSHPPAGCPLDGASRHRGRVRRSQPLEPGQAAVQRGRVLPARTHRRTALQVTAAELRRLRRGSVLRAGAATSRRSSAMAGGSA